MSRQHQRSVENKNKVGKRQRQNERDRLRNQAAKSRARTEIRKVRRAIESGEAAQSHEQLRLAVQSLDRAVSKGIIHRNNAARRKSRLMRQFNAALAQA